MKPITINSDMHSAMGTFNLPASKSVCNRLLIIQALGKDAIHLNDISDAEDSKDMARCLSSQDTFINAGSGGTTSRFMLAYLANKEGEWLLDASEQMRKRSIQPLVDALRQIGADITYKEQEGLLPVKIKGRNLDGGEIITEGGFSSQHISALMLIAPTLKNGLTITMQSPAVSQPYILMTAKLMRQCGVTVHYESKRIHIPNGQYTSEQSITVERDWSAAAFAYSMAALSTEPDIFLPGLMPSVLQGDSIVSDMFHYFKVKTTIENDGIRLTKGKERTPRLLMNLQAYPDITPALIVTCAALDIPAEVWGIAHLRHKESNRLEALRINLEQMGINIKIGEDILEISGKITVGTYTIQTFEDHRIAMAFSVLVLVGCSLNIDDGGCVTKSFPKYWHELVNMGVSIVE